MQKSPDFERGMVIKTKKWLLFAALLLLTGLLGGIVMLEADEAEQMLAYAEQKYGEEFIYLGPWGGQVGKPCSMIEAECKGRAGSKVLIRSRRENGRTCFEDNYLALLLQEELQNTIGQLAEQAYGECKVFYKIPELVFPEEFSPDMTKEEFLTQTIIPVQFYIYPREAKEEEKRLNYFSSLNREKGYRLRGTVSYPATYEDYEFLTQDNFLQSDYLGYKAKRELIFSMDENGEFHYVRWL